jgi:hypothetical protein
VIDAGGVIVDGSQPLCPNAGGDQLLQARLDYRALAPVDEFRLDGVWIDTDDIVSVTHQASGRDDADVAQAKNCNLHCVAIL